MILIDTNILIDLLRGKETARAFVQKHGKSNLAVCTVVAMELYQGCLNKIEFAQIKKEMSGFISIELNEDIGNIALQLSQKYALSHKMGVVDTLIAATALVYELELRTQNVKDFHFIPNIKVSNSLE